MTYAVRTLPPALAPAKPPVDLPPSDALSILKQTPPVTGRCLGVLVTDGADGAMLMKALKELVEAPLGLVA